MEKVIFFDYNSVFSRRLRSLIEEKNISKQKLADEIGVSRQAISQYCDGSTVPNADKLLKIAEYFNVSLDYLVGKTEAKTDNKDVKFICDYTGLNEKAIEILNKIHVIYKLDFLSFLIINSDIVFDVEDYKTSLDSNEKYLTINIEKLTSNIKNFIDSNKTKPIDEESVNDLTEMIENNYYKLIAGIDATNSSYYRIMEDFAECVEKYTLDKRRLLNEKRKNMQDTIVLMEMVKRNADNNEA